MKRRVFLIIIAAVLCIATAASALELTFSQMCRRKLSTATQLYTDPEGNGNLVPSTVLPAGTYVIPNGTSVNGLTGITYSTNDRTEFFGYVDGSHIVSAVQTVTLPSGKQVQVGEALVRSRTALNLWLEMEYGETLDGGTYKDAEGNEHEIGNEDGLREETEINGDAVWAKAVGVAFSKNGASVRTVYREDDGSETEVRVVYMGLARSMVELNGTEQLVETWRLSWDTDAEEDKVLAVVKSDSRTVKLRQKSGATSTSLEKISCNRVVQVVRYGKNYCMVDVNQDGVPLGYIATGALDFYPNQYMPYKPAKIGLRGRTDIRTDPIGIRATDETGSGSNWKIDSFRIGTPVSVYAQNDSWAEVDAGGYHAYLLNEYVVLDPEEQEN